VLQSAIRPQRKQFPKINPVDGTRVAQVTKPTARWSTRRCRAALSAAKGGPRGGMCASGARRAAAQSPRDRKALRSVRRISLPSSRPRSIPTPLENGVARERISTFPRGLGEFPRHLRTSCAPTATESYHLDTHRRKGVGEHARQSRSRGRRDRAPWNLPLLVFSPVSVAPCLACGNTDRGEASETGRFSTTTLLRKVITSPGVPAGVYTVVATASVRMSAGEFTARTHPGVNGMPVHRRTGPPRPDHERRSRRR